jgi:hypothetical protein
MNLVTDPDNPANLYCAGLFEGEGTFGCSLEVLPSGNPRKRFWLAIGMTNREPLDKFEDIMQVGNVTGPYLNKNPRSKPYWRYSLTKTDEIKYVIENMWDWLSEVRKQQWQKALDFYEEK